MTMKSMKLSKKEAKGEVAIDVPDGPRFPHGLTLHLEDETLKKLGIANVPDVGTEMRVVGVGVVESSNQHQSQRRKNRSISIQLQRLDVKPTKKATAEDAVSDAIKDV